MSESPAAKNLWTKVAVAVIAAVPPSGTLALEPKWVTANPVRSGLILLAYLLVLYLVRIVGGAAEVWVDRATRAVADLPRMLTQRGRYSKRLMASVSSIELHGVGTSTGYPVEIEAVYVDVGMVSSRIEEAVTHRFTGVSPENVDGVMSFDAALGKSSNGVAVFVGGPGTGKTTVLRRSALRLCRFRFLRFTRRPLPVLVELRSHVAAITSPSAPTLAELVADSNWLDDAVSRSWLEKHLRSGRCQVMFDGLDEVSTVSARRLAKDWIERQIAHYPGNTFVVTARPFGYESNRMDTAHLWELKGFTESQVGGFLHAWYRVAEQHDARPQDSAARTAALAARRADDLLERLRGNQRLYDLAGNPLLLTMIALVHRYSREGELPETRAALYKEVCELLLYRRRESAGLGAVGSALDGEQKLLLAGRLAWCMMDSPRRNPEIHTVMARDVLRDTVREIPGRFAAQDFLRDAVEHGLLLRPTPDHYAFAHLSLQEYLAALDVLDRRADADLLPHINDPEWREVMLLWSGRTDPSAVVDACLDSGTDYAVKLAFDCADRARTLSRASQERVNRLRASTRDDPEFLTAVAAEVRGDIMDAVPLSGGALLCSRPVTAEQYRAFSNDERMNRRHRELDADDGSGLAVGMWGVDAAAYVAWNNELSAEGPRLRLPTPEEMDDPAVGSVCDITRYRVWTRDSRHIGLFSGSGTLDSFTLNGISTASRLRADRERTVSMMYAVCAFANVLAHGFPLRRSRALELLSGLDDALAGAYAGGAGHARAVGRDASRVLARELVEEFELDLDLGPDVEQAFARSRSGDVDRAVERDQAQHPSAVAAHQAPFADGRTPVDVMRALPRTGRRALVTAYAALTTMWEPRGVKRHDLAEFDAYLSELVTPAASIPVMPEEIPLVLGLVRESFEGHPRREEGPGGIDARGVADRLLCDIDGLVSPMVGRREPPGGDAIRCARMAVAALAACAHRIDPAMWRELDAHLGTVLSGLTVIEQRIAGGIDANEVILLVHDDADEVARGSAARDPSKRPAPTR